MAYTTINKSTDNFNTKIWTGTGSSGHAITGVGFQPDLLWIKARTNTSYHHLFDAVRGKNKLLYPNVTDAESTDSSSISSFDSDGFTLGSAGGGTNSGSNNFVGWSWKANGAGSSNTDGTITSTVSVNTTAGFSIVKWTGTNSNGTIGHGLGATPSLFISKSMAGTHNWGVYHKSIGIGSSTLLNTNAASDPDATYYGGTSPTSTIMGLGTANATNASGNMIGYAFAEKTGYSKIGSYVGNGNADGSFVYTGFKPSLIIIKDTANAAENWFIFDNKRPGYNFNANLLNPNDTATETTSGANGIDILSNGFKARSTNNGTNRSGANFIYMAIGQSLVGSNNVPCTAR